MNGKDISAATGARLGSLLQDLSADAERAKEHRGRFVLAFENLGVRDTPVYAAPRVREFCRALEAGCPYAAYFLSPDPLLACVGVFLLAQIPLVPSEGAWRYSLQDYVEATREHIRRVADFCRRVGDDEDAATEGLLLNLPAEALSGQPGLRARVLLALAPAVRAAIRDFRDLNAHPEGRQILRDLLSRGEALTGLSTSPAPSLAAFERLMRSLP